MESSWQDEKDMEKPIKLLGDSVWKSLGLTVVTPK